MITAAPSASRGEIVLQPTYFTSSIFVNALRDDINSLVLIYYHQYTNTRPANPFSLFKALWSSQGWKWMHFKVFDNRARESFLNVTLRLFLERTVETEAPYIRAIALFGLYTFYFTQPSGTAPVLHRVVHIPIPIDQYAPLKALPNSLTEDHLLPLQPIVCHIISTLLTDGVFSLVPSTSLGALNPRDLPREIFVNEETIMPVDPTVPRKKGRPTRLDKAKKAKSVLHNLERWLQDTSNSQTPSTTAPPDLTSASRASHTATTETEATLARYRDSKSRLLSKMDFHERSGGASQRRTAFRQANQFVLDRLKTAEELLASDDGSSSNGPNAVLARVEHAVKEFIEAEEEGRKVGILGLLGGSD